MMEQSVHAKNIVILHRIPYQKVGYHDVIDHDVHNVYYISTQPAQDIPKHVRHTNIVVLESNYIEDAVCRILSLGIQVDILFALSEYHLIAAELMRSALGIVNPARHSKAVYNCRDKWLMKQCVVKAGIKTAHSQIVAGVDIEKALVGVNPFIVKPVRGASSENTHRFDSPKSFLTSSYNKQYLTSQESFLVEEFIEGDIYHFDGLVHEGKVLFSIGSRYVGTCLEFSNGSPLGSFQLDDSSLYDEQVQNCVSAVGIQSGAFHLEMIKTAEGMYFLEIGNRAGGAGVVIATKHLMGINLMQEEVRMILAGKAYTPRHKNPSHKRYGWLVVPADSFQPDITASDLSSGFPELISLDVKPSVLGRDFISYAEEHNPCTGIVEAQSHEQGMKIIHSVFDFVQQPLLSQQTG